MKTTEFMVNTAAPRSPEASVLIIYTGGTIGMLKDREGSLIPFNFKLVMEHLPSIKSFNISLKVISFDDPLDSSNIKAEHWIDLAGIIADHYNEFDGFVVLHGTDTMAYSASALSFLLEGLTKPVVFTGAQLPVVSRRSDAPENLITSIEFAAAKKDGRAIVPEVCIYFDYLLLRGNRAVKVESQHFDAFKSENYPPLAEAGIEIDYNPQYIDYSRVGEEFSICKKMNSHIGLLKLYPGIPPAMVKSVLRNSELKGVVLETFGSGNAPTEDWFLEEITYAVNNNVVLMNVSQCIGGTVQQGAYRTSKKLMDAGVISGHDITAEAAITKMMYLFGKDISIDEVKKLLPLPLRGELLHRKH